MMTIFSAKAAKLTKSMMTAAQGLLLLADEAEQTAKKKADEAIKLQNEAEAISTEASGFRTAAQNIKTLFDPATIAGNAAGETLKLKAVK